ncbi:MAG: nitroreductase [Planctomycetota bacterium]
MDVHQALRARRTVHAYQPARALPEGALERALEAAHLAPNHRFTYPWRFVLPGPAARGGLAEVAVAEAERKRPLTEEGRAKARAKALDPSELVVLCQRLDPDPGVREEDYAAVSCAAQNLMLSLAGDGVGTKWSTGGLTRAPETYALLGVDPAAERIVGFIWAGYPSADPAPPARPPLADFVRRIP